MRILLDAMGGDNAPDATIRGAVSAINEIEAELVLIGQEAVINAKAQIVEPILIVENNPAIDITETKNYGEYIFKIKNYNDQGKLSECDLKYYIELLTKLDNSINIELYQGENKIELHNNKTEFMKIEKNQKEDREYKIKVTYDNENTEVGNDILEKIQIKVHTEQEKA